MTNSSKNVVWLHSHFLYWMGGTKFIFEVANQLIKSKKVKTLTLVVENGSPTVLEKFAEQNIQVINLNSSTSTSPVYWLCLPFFLKQRQQQLNNLLTDKKFKPTNTVLISSMFPMNVIASYFPKYRHIQKCYEPFAFFYDQEFVKDFSALKRIFISILKFLYANLDIQATKAATVLLTLNSVTRELMREIYGRSSQLTQVGVNTELFRPYSKKQIAPELLKKFASPKIVVHSTDYSPVKGTDRVITAFAKIKSKHRDALLVITTTISDQTAQLKLQQLAEKLKVANQVKFAGFLPIEHLPMLYSMSLVLVQGSASNKSGTTSMAMPVKEAMACGTIAIRPDIGADEVIDQKSGYLCDPRDSGKLAKIIDQILKNPQKSKRMGKLARETIVAKYSWKKTANVFLKQL